MVTVFTPTYNRAYRLPMLYESLKRQTSPDFEWVVVDDGSSDNTEELVESWKKECNKFAIIYRKKENGGKHTAINVGVPLAHYEWFMIVDSDDFLRDDAIEKVCEWTKNLDDTSIAGVSGTKCYKDLSTIGGEPKISGKYIDCYNNQRRKYKLWGDKAEVYRTEIMKKYPFPVFEGEKFLSEGLIWDRIAMDGFKVRWYDYPLVVCEYLEDGLSAKMEKDIELENFNGYTCLERQNLKSYHGLIRYCHMCNYIRKARKKRLTSEEIAEKLGVSTALIMVLMPLVTVREWHKRWRKKNG